MLNCVQILTLANIKVYLDEKSFLFDLCNNNSNININNTNNSINSIVDIKVSGFSESIKGNLDLVDSLPAMN